MNPDLVVFAVGIACLAIGIFGTDALIHRPARIAYQAALARVRDDHEQACANHQAALAEVKAEAAIYLRKIGEVAADKAHAVIRADNLASELVLQQRLCDAHTTATERRAWLPTIEGNYLDLVADLPVGFRLDWAEFGAETPIGMAVLSERIADVVEIRGGKR